MSAVQQALDAFEREFQRFEAREKALYDPSTGAQIYSDVIHEQKLAEALQPLQEAATRAEELAGRLEGEAQALESEEEGGRPIDYLDDATIARANTRREFVKEEIEGLVFPALMKRLAEVRRRGDKADLFLYSRYGVDRLEGLELGQRADLAATLREMEQALLPEGKASVFRQKRLEAQQLRALRSKLWQVDGTMEQQIAAKRASYSEI
jgi:hypothetical protein